VKHYKEGCKNVHDDPRSSQPSVVNEDLVHAVKVKIQENKRFTTSSLSLHFPQISRSLPRVEFLPQGSTINAGVYCDTLKKLHRAIQNKRRGMLSRGVVMLHDNARPHTAAATQDLIAKFGWEQFDHPPYSPDLAPSDFMCSCV
jgi:hypothetical protein